MYNTINDNNELTTKLPVDIFLKKGTSNRSIKSWNT